MASRYGTNRLNKSTRLPNPSRYAVSGAWGAVCSRYPNAVWSSPDGGPMRISKTLSDTGSE